MKDENGRLRKLLAEKDYEINYLKKKIDDEKSIIGIGKALNKSHDESLEKSCFTVAHFIKDL